MKRKERTKEETKTKEINDQVKIELDMLVCVTRNHDYEKVTAIQSSIDIARVK